MVAAATKGEIQCGKHLSDTPEKLTCQALSLEYPLGKAPYDHTGEGNPGSKGRGFFGQRSSPPLTVGFEGA